MEQIPMLSYGGRSYSGTYEVTGAEVVISHNRQFRKAALSGRVPSSLAQQLLYELVVLEGRGLLNLRVSASKPDSAG